MSERIQIKLKCKECGEVLEPDAQFCHGCGAKLGGAACPQCNYPVESGWKVCPECGTILDEEKRRQQEGQQRREAEERAKIQRASKGNNVNKSSEQNEGASCGNNNRREIELKRIKDEILATKKNGDAISKPLFMPIEDVFSISGRGIVVTGQIQRGVVKTGNEVEIVGIKPTIRTLVTGIEKSRKLTNEAIAGESVGILLKELNINQVERGQVVAAPQTATSHSSFTANIFLLTREEGGNNKPIADNSRIKFYFNSIEITGSVSLRENIDYIMPGDVAAITVSLITSITLEQGMQFAIREDGRTIGAGIVTNIIK